MATLDRIRQRVAEIISDKGKTVVYKAVSKSYSRETGGTTETVTSTTVKVSPPEPYATRFVDGDLIKVGDTSVLLADYGSEITPNEGDKITIDSEDWTIVRVEKTYSGELVAAWGLQLRK